jgi:hypothetical protein
MMRHGMLARVLVPVSLALACGTRSSLSDQPLDAGARGTTLPGDSSHDDPKPDEHRPLDCGLGASSCSNHCVDLQVDPEHCGTCGHACGQGTHCSEGSCEVCPRGQIACDRRCVDPETDALHCGATSGCGADSGNAGIRCANDSACVEGTCVACPWFEGLDELPLATTFLQAPLILNLDGAAYDEVIMRYKYSPPDVAILHRIFEDGVHTERLPIRGSLRKADVDGDGRDDVLAADQAAIDVWRSDAKGQLSLTASLSPFSNRASIHGIATGDFNGDHELDIAGLANDIGGLQIFRGRGDGTFVTGESISLESAPGELVSAQLNRDGHSDLLASVRQSIQPALAASSGAAWTLPQRVEGNGVGISPRVKADLTGDGLDDLLDSSFGVRAALGDGSFAAAVPFEEDQRLAPYPGRLENADLNGDGLLDLAFMDDGITSIWLQSSPGKFHLAGEYEGEGLFGNLAGHGALDMVVATYGISTFVVRQGVGDGSFRGPRVYAGRDTDRSAWPLVVDLDGNGVLDILTPLTRDDDYYGDLLTGIEVRAGDGRGGFGEPRLVLAQVPAFVEPELALGDLNTDGRLDVIAFTAGDEKIFHVWLGQPDGSLGAYRQEPHDCGWRSNATLEDVDGDGDDDVVFLAGSCFVRNDGQGRLGGTVKVEPHEAPALPAGGLRKDLNRDMLTDVFAPVGDGFELTWGFREGGLSAPVSLPGVSQLRTGTLGNAFLVDLDRDSTKDLVLYTGDVEHHWVSVLPGLTAGGFGVARSYEFAYDNSSDPRYHPPSGFATADFNHDGFLDLVVGGREIMLSNAHGFYDQRGSLPCAVPLVVEDISGDGLVDLVCSRSYGRGLTVWLGADRSACH